MPQVKSQVIRVWITAGKETISDSEHKLPLTVKELPIITMTTWKIHRLTRRQERRLIACRDEWLSIATSCEPVDFNRAKRAASACFQKAGIMPPKRFILSQGPADTERWARKMARSLSATENDTELTERLRETIRRLLGRVRST